MQYGESINKFLYPAHQLSQIPPGVAEFSHENSSKLKDCMVYNLCLVIGYTLRRKHDLHTLAHLLPFFLSRWGEIMETPDIRSTFFSAWRNASADINLAPFRDDKACS